MKGFYMNILSRYFSIALLFTVSLSARMVVIDQEELVADFMNSLQQKAQKIQSDVQQEGMVLYQEMQALENKKNDLKKEDYEAKKALLEKKMMTKQQEAQSKMAPLQKEAEAKMKEVQGVVEEQAKKNGWTVVVPKQATIYVDKTNDVTSQVSQALKSKSCPVKK